MYVKANNTLLGSVESNKIDNVYTNNATSIISATTDDKNIDHYNYTQYILNDQVESKQVISDFDYGISHIPYSRFVYNEDDIRPNDTIYFDYIINTNSSSIYADFNDTTFNHNVISLGNNLYRVFGFYTVTSEDSNRYNNVYEKRFMDINYQSSSSSRKLLNEYLYINPQTTTDIFTDNLSVAGDNILYKVEAVDKAGNISESTYVLVNNTTNDTLTINKITTTAKDYYSKTLQTSGTLILPANNSTLGLSDNTLSGTVYIKSDGRVAFQGANNNKCEVKRFDYPNVELLNNTNNICSKNIYKNLVINGYGEYGDNTNFEQFTYNSSTNAFSLDVTTGYLATFTSKLIPINPSRKYDMQMDLSSSITIEGTNLLGFSEVDIDKNDINALLIMYVDNTLTTLAQDLKNGDTVVYLNDLTNWSATSSTYDFQRGFIFWNYKNSFGYQYPALTYSRNVFIKGDTGYFTYNNVNKTNNSITLNSPWEGGNISKNTQVSQSSAGSTYKYTLSYLSSINTSYQTFKSPSYITGIEYNNSSFYAFNYATKYIRVFTQCNYLSPKSNLTYIYMKNIIFEEVD